jgi:hypothetical protein
LPLSLSQSPPTKSQAFQTPGKISNALKTNLIFFNKT